mgnify:CR=1 FL=1
MKPNIPLPKTIRFGLVYSLVFCIAYFVTTIWYEKNYELPNNLRLNSQAKETSSSDSPFFDMQSQITQTERTIYLPQRRIPSRDKMIMLLQSECRILITPSSPPKSASIRFIKASGVLTLIPANDSNVYYDSSICNEASISPPIPRATPSQNQSEVSYYFSRTPQNCDCDSSIKSYSHPFLRIDLRHLRDSIISIHSKMLYSYPLRYDQSAQFPDIKIDESAYQKVASVVFGNKSITSHDSLEMWTILYGNNNTGKSFPIDITGLHKPFFDWLE